MYTHITTLHSVQLTWGQTNISLLNTINLEVAPTFLVDCGEDLATVLNLVVLGEREAGSVGGRVSPALAFSNRCMAMANSSGVRRPSLSTSASSLDVCVREGGREGGREGWRERERA